MADTRTVTETRTEAVISVRNQKRGNPYHVIEEVGDGYVFKHNAFVMNDDCLGIVSTCEL